MSFDPNAPPAPSISTRPHLSPSLCFNTTALRDFLRISRNQTDDSLSLHLNALIEPSRRPFSSSPSSTSSTSNRPIGSRQIPGSACQEFKHKTLFPNWQIREEVIAYCEQVADMPEAPETVKMVRPQMRMPSDKMNTSTNDASMSHVYNANLSSLDDSSNVPSSEPKDFWGHRQVVDERLDPYSGRDYSYTYEGQAAGLRSILTSERGVERIVRSRTWTLLGERCLDDSSEETWSPNRTGWEAEWKRWKEERG